MFKISVFIKVISSIIEYKLLSIDEKKKKKIVLIESIIISVIFTSSSNKLTSYQIRDLIADKIKSIAKIKA